MVVTLHALRARLTNVMPYDGEDRILVPSPKVATYDLKPEMSAYEVKDKTLNFINIFKRQNSN